MLSPAKQVELKALEMQTAPLRGLDKRVAETRDQIKSFYSDRIPAHYSVLRHPDRRPAGQIGRAHVAPAIQPGQTRARPD